MARFVARVHNLTDNQPELVEIEAASVGDALRILAEEGFGTLDLMTAEDASAKGLKGRLIGPKSAATVSASVEIAHPRLVGRSVDPLAILVELLGIPVLLLVALPALKPVERSLYERPEPQVSLTALGLLAVITLSPLWLRPASTRSLTAQQRFGLWALIGIAGLTWWRWISYGEVDKVPTTVVVMLIVGLITMATYQRMGWVANRTSAGSSTKH